MRQAASGGYFSARDAHRCWTGAMRANFREFAEGEVRRIPLPRTSVNKGKKKRKGRYKLRPFLFQLTTPLRG
jgi:hypothetical protein